MSLVIRATKPGQVPPRTLAISNFLNGIGTQEALANSFCYGLGYVVIPKGIEHSYAASNKELLKESWTTDDKETLANIQYMRKEPDLLVVTPSKKVWYIEVKAKTVGSLTAHLNNNYSMNEIKEVSSMYPTVRFVYVDLPNRKIRSISALDQLTLDGQVKNWEEPWSWLEGINTEDEYQRWSDACLFNPMILSAEKTIDKASQFVSEEELSF